MIVGEWKIPLLRWLFQDFCLQTSAFGNSGVFLHGGSFGTVQRKYLQWKKFFEQREVPGSGQGWRQHWRILCGTGSQSSNISKLIINCKFMLKTCCKNRCSESIKNDKLNREFNYNKWAINWGVLLVFADSLVWILLS